MVEVPIDWREELCSTSTSSTEDQTVSQEGMAECRESPLGSPTVQYIPGSIRTQHLQERERHILEEQLNQLQEQLMITMMENHTLGRFFLLDITSSLC